VVWSIQGAAESTACFEAYTVTCGKLLTIKFKWQDLELLEIFEYSCTATGKVKRSLWKIVRQLLKTLNTVTI